MGFTPLDPAPVVPVIPYPGPLTGAATAFVPAFSPSQGSPVRVAAEPPAPAKPAGVPVLPGDPVYLPPGVVLGVV